MHIDLLWWWVCSWHGMTIRMKMNDGRVSSSSSMLVWLHYKRNALCEFNRPQITNRLERFNSPVNEGIWSTSRYLNQAVEDFWKETTFKRWIFFEFFTEKRLVWIILKFLRIYWFRSPGTNTCCVALFTFNCPVIILSQAQLRYQRT